MMKLHSLGFGPFILLLCILIQTEAFRGHQNYHVTKPSVRSIVSAKATSCHMESDADDNKAFRPSHSIKQIYSKLNMKSKNIVDKLKHYAKIRKDDPMLWLSKISRKARMTIISLFACWAVGMGNMQRAAAVKTGEKSTVTATAVAHTSLPLQDSHKTKKTVSLEFVVADAKKGPEVVAHGSGAHTSSVSRRSSKKQPPSVEKEVVEEVQLSLQTLSDSLKGAKLDTLIMLLVTSAVIPIFKRLNASPILGFLMMGTLLGPSCLQWVHDVHTIDLLGELGIVFFLFEMGLELSVARLKAMRKDVFGLGTSQFVTTAAVGAAVCTAAGLSLPASVTIGGSLALSSSAFVLQLLKDNDEMGTRFGKASFGILLLQDLAVVPLLVVVELLCKGGTGLGRALAVAAVKAFVAIFAMGALGKTFLDPLFYFVAKSSSQEAFLSIIMTTVLLMSFVTKGIGLSDTLGAFLAGLLLSETRYKYQVEADIAPFRGLLLGFFFMTVGFNIDLAMVVKDAPLLLAMLATLLIGKAGIITGLSLAFGMSPSNAQHTGLLTSQGGEFAFVALGTAARSGLIEPKLSKLLMTTVALSMALTPTLAGVAAKISRNIEQGMGYAHYTGMDKDAHEMKNSDFVLVCGYGRVGKMVCDMLDRRSIRYICLDSSPQLAIEARSKGLPVFYGDINRPEVLRNFNVGKAKACVFTIDDMSATNRAVITLRKMFPDLPLVVRAKNTQHQKKLESMFDNVSVMSPVLPEDSVLLTLPFGGAVLQRLGVSKPEIEAILEELRKNYMDSAEQDSYDFLSNFKMRLPPSLPESDANEIDPIEEQFDNTNNWEKTPPVSPEVVHVASLSVVDVADSEEVAEVAEAMDDAMKAVAEAISNDFKPSQPSMAPFIPGDNMG